MGASRGPAFLSRESRRTQWEIGVADLQCAAVAGEEYNH